MVEVTPVIRRTVAVMRREGVGGTVQRAIKYARLALGMPTAETAAYYRRREEETRAFDGAKGVDTGGTVHVFALTTDSPNKEHAGPYIAAGVGQFATAMGLLDIDVAGITFVDLGSGKGRALFLAAEYPFAAITGVEFTRELYDTSVENIARVGDPRISNTLGDAEQFAYPPGPMVVFMNNPFDRPLVARVVARLTADLRANPRLVRVVYINHAAADLFTAAGWSVVADEYPNIVLKLD